MDDLGNPWARSWAMTMMLLISYCCSMTYQPNSVKAWRMFIFYIVLHWICCTHWILSGSILSGKNGAIEAQHSPAHIQLLPTSFNFTILLSHSHFRSVQVCSGCQGWLRSTIADEVGGGTPGAVSSLKVWEMAKGRKYMAWMFKLWLVANALNTSVNWVCFKSISTVRNVFSKTCIKKYHHWTEVSSRGWVVYSDPDCNGMFSPNQLAV